MEILQIVNIISQIKIILNYYVNNVKISTLFQMILSNVYKV